jgi:DNA-binding response OmpR family regulator
MKVLLIDDSWEFTEPIKFFLEKNGYIVDVIDDSDAAYDKTENLKGYDIILLDLMLPIGSKCKVESHSETGIFLYTKIRNKYKKIPIIIVSALNENRYKTCWINDNFVKYVGKCSFRKLKFAIESFN